MAKRKQYMRKKVVTSLVVVVIAFLLCWYPLYTLNALVYFAPETAKNIPAAGFYITIVMSHFSSAINPLIYAYTMPGFKEAFLLVLRCKFLQNGIGRRQSTDFTIAEFPKPNINGTPMKELKNLTPGKSSVKFTTGEENDDTLTSGCSSTKLLTIERRQSQDCSESQDLIKLSSRNISNNVKNDSEHNLIVEA